MKSQLPLHHHPSSFVSSYSSSLPFFRLNLLLYHFLLPHFISLPSVMLSFPHPSLPPSSAPIKGNQCLLLHLLHRLPQTLTHFLQSFTLLGQPLGTPLQLIVTLHKLSCCEEYFVFPSTLPSCSS